MPPTYFTAKDADGHTLTGDPDDDGTIRVCIWYGVRRPIDINDAVARLNAARDAWFDDNSAPNV